MCGIAGVFGAPDAVAVRAMLAVTRHRGEDETAADSWDGLCSLGINRLSIVDVAGGQQPLADAIGRLHVVCNGEIYNHEAIRLDLSASHAFVTGSDAEAIVHLYDAVGEECVRQLDGMFAFVLYDGRRRTFLAARDRFGIKPLYYAHHDGLWYFASEAKAFLEVTLPPDAIQMLPPGHLLTPAGPRGYYALDDHRRKSMPNPQLLRALLEQSVATHLMGDPEIKVGTYLSGGIDSSIVTALVAKFRPDVVAFSVGMEDSPDVVAARRVAEHLGIRHVVRAFGMDEVRAMIPRAIYAIESYNPVMLLEGLMSMMLARVVKEHGIKVVLCGEGADEIFAGYGVFRDKPPLTLNAMLRETVGQIHNTECLRLDRATMAYSLEARVPFLDPQVVQYAVNLPAAALIGNDGERPVEKWILRKACEDLLPPEIVWRMKLGFDHGSGILGLIDELDVEIADEEVVQAQADFPHARIRSKTQLFLFRLWQETFGDLGGERVYDLFGAYPSLQAVIDARTSTGGGTGETPEDLERLRLSATRAVNAA